MRLLLVCAAGAALASASVAQAVEGRQVTAPASDILAGVVRLPDPADAALRSRSFLARIELAPGGDGWTWEAEVPVDAPGPLALAVLAPDGPAWTVRVTAPGAEEEALPARPGVERRTQRLDGVLGGMVADRFDLGFALAGTWRVRVDAPAGARPSDGMLLAAGAGRARLTSHVSTHELVLDGSPAVVARLFDARDALERTALGWVEEAEVDLDVDGARSTLAMADDGLHADGAAKDGVFGAWLPTDRAGQARARITLRGSGPNGRAFARSVLQSFPLLQRRALLTGSVETRVEDELRLGLDLGLWRLGPGRLHVSAEVWGRDVAGVPVPVCWLSRMLSPEERAQGTLASLSLDVRWLDVAGASAPLDLRNVRLQDPDTEVVFDLRERLEVPVADLPPVVGRGAREVTPDMLRWPLAATVGGTGSVGQHGQGTPILLRPALMLVHGYCSGGSPWPAAHFSQPKITFLDPNQNRSHDQFAQLLLQFGASNASSFGIVAHSQGGPAALHLVTYYASGLDVATGPRLIQSVGSPYQGTPLASWGGFACGVNNNMTPSGSATWLAGIPTWARNEVFYWTTSDAGSACNFFTNLLLSDPEDGTTERDRDQLPGGHNMGHTTGWCHTTGMTYPAQYTDASRNAQMNAQAAR